MDNRRKTSGCGGLSSQTTFKFSALRNTGDEDELDYSPSSSPPKPSSSTSTATHSQAGQLSAESTSGSFEDFLNAVPKPQVRHRPPSAFARHPAVTAAAAAAASIPTPPAPPAPPPPPPPLPQQPLPSASVSAPAKIATVGSAQSSLSGMATNGDPADADVEENVQDSELDDEDATPQAISSSPSASQSAQAVPWPFGSEEDQQAESAAGRSSQPRVIRTDSQPPNPLTGKFSLLFTLLVAAISIVLVSPLPLPDLVKGLVIGCSLACCALVYFYLEFLANKPVIVHYTGVKYCRNPRASVLTAVMAATAPSARRGGQLQLDGFLNECWIYDVEKHHLNHTFTVYANLDGRRLTLRRPQQAVPKRLLFSDEAPSLDSLTFSDTRQFDLANAKLRLQPEGLVRKRLWSKKYPIHVVLAAPATAVKPAASSASSSASALKFEEVSASDCVQRELYLFARTSREKELWYRRLYAACNGLPQPEALYRTAVDVNSSGRSNLSSFGDQAKRYAEYAAAFTRFADISDVQLGSADKPELNFLNALLQRSTWDVFRTPYWADLIKAKMDARLKKIRLPYFIEELSVADVNVGNALPVLRKLHKPHINDRGIWFHLDIDYPGGCSASLVTRINLTRLQERGGAQASSSATAAAAAAAAAQEEAIAAARCVVSSASADSISGMAAGHCPFSDSAPQRLAATNSELEDSGESTTDESGGQSEPDSDGDDPALGNVGGKHSRKVIKFIDKVAQSEKFHNLLGKYKFLRKAVDSVSNTKILLSVDVHSLRGTLVLNMPFPPSDRVWVAFHPTPQLVLTSRPKIGEKEFNARKISDLISKKLIAEFHRVFVLPNMEDLYLPTLNSDEALLASAPPISGLKSGTASGPTAGFQPSASTMSL